MSDTPEPGPRATMDLVYRAVDDLGKQVGAHFETVNARLDQLTDLPHRVSDIEGELVTLRIWKQDQDARQEQERLAEEARRSRRWTGMLPAAVGLMGIFAALITTLVTNNVL